MQQLAPFFAGGWWHVGRVLGFAGPAGFAGIGGFECFKLFTGYHPSALPKGTQAAGAAVFPNTFGRDSQLFSDIFNGHEFHPLYFTRQVYLKNRLSVNRLLTD